MNAILAFTDHDYKDMIFEINRVRDLIKSTSIKYSDVDFIYSDAVSAMRNYLNLKPETFELTVKITKNDAQDILRVKTSHAIFGPQPFLAIKDKQGRYYWDNFDFAIPVKNGHIRLITPFEFVRHVLHEKQRQDVVLVLGGVHASSQLITACP